MHDVPDTPAVADAPDVLAGHLWLQERVDGTPLRAQVRDAAPVRFGDGTRTFDASDAPHHLQYAVHEVQRHLDREALRRTVDDVEAVTFVGVATHRQRVDYDWDALPGFLGTDVWDGTGGTGRWLPPDRAEQVFERLDLAPVNTVAREVRAADFHPDRYDFPASNWRDGPVTGIVVRNKTGGRAVLDNPDVMDAGGPSTDPSFDHEATPEERADHLAEALATDDVFQRIADAVRADETRTLTFDSLQQGVLDAIYREHAPTFESVSVDHDVLRRAVAERTSAFMG